MPYKADGAPESADVSRRGSWEKCAQRIITRIGFIKIPDGTRVRWFQVIQAAESVY